MDEETSSRPHKHSALLKVKHGSWRATCIHPKSEPSTGVGSHSAVRPVALTCLCNGATFDPLLVFVFVGAGHGVGGLHCEGPQHVRGVRGRPEGGVQALLAVGDRGDAEEEQAGAAHRRAAGDKGSVLL